MSELSRLASTLYDYARSVAKNHWGEKVTKLHLFAAIRKWDKDKFDQKFAGLDVVLENALKRTKGNALQIDGVDPSVIHALEGVESEEDMWTLASALQIELGDLLTSEPATESASERAQEINDEDAIEPTEEELAASSRNRQTKTFALLPLSV